MKQAQGVYFGKNAVLFTSKEKTPKPTTVKIKEISGEFGKGKIASWGDDNRYPQKFLDELKLNGAALGGLGLLKSVHYGNGLAFYSNKIDRNGKRDKVVKTLESYPEIKEFWKRNKMLQLFISSIADLETFSMAKPEFILSKNFKKIYSVRRQKTAWCRQELINPKTGFSEHTYINAKWEGTNTDSEYVSKVPCVNPMWSTEDIRYYCKQKKIYKFILPIHYTMMDETYYNRTSWHSVYHNGWMDVSNSIPKYKKHLFENQMNVKYVVYISDIYFEDEYGDDWEEFGIDKRKKIKEELISAIDNHLSGNESSGRSIYSKKIKDIDGNLVKAIEIEPIDNLIKDGSYLPDASAANSEILFSMGVDPTLVGGGNPSSPMSPGSDSGKRIAFSILSALFKTKRETSIQLWEFIKEFNGYPDELQANYENMVLTTLDKNPTGQVNGI